MSKSTCKAAKPAPVECIALSEDWNAGWRFETNGKFTGGADPRGLYSVRHPFAESQTGDRADLVRSLSVPREWTGPVILSFFATDNHHGTGYDPAKWPHYVGADIFKGHRFLQVLVAGQMVWEQDVAESDSPGWRHGLENAAYENIHHIADLTGLVKPGQTAPLILRVLDKTGSGVALPGDVHQGHYWEPVDYDRTVNNKWFDFTGWWGDVTLSADRSTAAQVQPTFAGHIRLAGPQLAPRPAEGPLRVELAIARAETLPAMPYPLWGGVPFPAGAAQDAGNIRLLDENGEDTPCQVQVCSRWPQDGSVQWAWLNVMALPGQKKFTMECGKAVARPPAASSLNITSANGRCTLRTGAVTVVFAEGQPALIESIQLEGRPPFGPITGILNQQMLGSLRRHRAVVRVVKVEEDGPVRASIRLEGDLTDEQGRTFGPFTARLTAWSGSALLGFSYRIFQQTDQLVAIVDDLLLEVALPCQNEFAGSFTLKTFGRPLPEGQVRELELRQPYGQPGAASPDAGGPDPKFRHHRQKERTDRDRRACARLG